MNEAGSEFLIIKGIEANLLPDGTIDTEMVAEGKFELVNTSIHPDMDPEGYAPFLEDPQKYTDLVIAGIKNPRTNIMAHIGYGVSKGEAKAFVEALDWEQIAQEALDNTVAIEINLRSLMLYIYQEMMDKEKYPDSDTSYRKTFAEALPELVPLLSSAEIRNRLKPFFERGLTIAINTDQHESPFIHKKNADFSEYDIDLLDVRFLRCLKIAEAYFNSLFNDTGIEQRHIINTYSAEDLQKFLQKARLEN